MNKLAVRTYTEQLESTITKGIELRNFMLEKNASLQHIIQCQRNELTNAVVAKELYQRRLASYKKRLTTEREKRQKAEGKLERQIKRYNEQEAFYSSIKEVANEMGIWAELVAQVKERQNG